MANSLSTDEILSNKHIRSFIQFGSARPNNPVKYAGQDAQYLIVDGLSAPESGGIDPTWVHDPRRSGKYKLVARKISPPDLAQATITLLERHGSIPRQLQRIGCQFNLYQPAGNCKDLSDFLAGWTDYVLVLAGALVTDKDLGARTAWQDDNQIEDKLTVKLADVYPVGALGFGENAATQVDREVVDIVYGSSEQCGDCGVPDDGTQRIYALVTSSGSGSPGLPPEVVYSITGGQSWLQMNITGMGATVTPTFIDVVGSRLVVGSLSEGAYYWSDLDINGNPSSTWTKVTAGFVASKGPRDIYVNSPREVYICGDGGYIYKATDITAGVSVINAGSTTSNNLFRIHGKDDTIVCVGAASTVIKSINRGATFTPTTSSPSGTPADIQAVVVLDKQRYWVGSALGRMYYTLDGGETWVHLNFSGAGDGQVRDIVAVNDEVLYFSHDTTTPTARLWATWNGGADWTRTAPRVNGWPTFSRANRLAVPLVDSGVAANNIAVAGLSGGGVDGIVLLGIAGTL